MELKWKWSWLFTSIYWWCEEWVALYLYSLHTLSWHVWRQLYLSSSLLKKDQHEYYIKSAKKRNLRSTPIKLSIQNKVHATWNVLSCKNCWRTWHYSVNSNYVLSDWNIIFRQSVSKWMRGKKMKTAKYGLLELVLTKLFQQIQPVHLPAVLVKIYCLLLKNVYKSLKKVRLTRSCMAKTNYLMQYVYRIIF